MLRRKAMSWRRVSKSLQALAAHAFLFCFTLLLVLKLDHVVYYSWWFILFPLWLFHAVVARGRFSLPAPSVPHGRHWAPCHAVVATPLLIAFELLLCIYLESIDVNSYAALNLKIVFLPLLAFEIIILIDNFRFSSIVDLLDTPTSCVTWTRLKSMEYPCRHDLTRVRVRDLCLVRQFESGYGPSCCRHRSSIEVVAVLRWERSSPSLCPADNIRPVNMLQPDRSAPRLTPTKLRRPLPDSDETSLSGCDLCDLVGVPI
ncbi:transmembrane Fragile-X-F-associated protein [Actinidia rufa]|uniref:Transmembrane Fragile-X-F-associated protein n=1 Tax=Actinidia rufa TaxID=165716 RepID=A0A7J0G536_9ERIC|nr:transmembrane Fragile-X-F-associated protein [Actinidia rufa]